MKGGTSVPGTCAHSDSNFCGQNPAFPPVSLQRSQPGDAATGAKTAILTIFPLDLDVVSDKTALLHPP
jgi:hypothetical protein